MREDNIEASLVAQPSLAVEFLKTEHSLKGNALLVLDLALAQREAALLLWQESPATFTWRDFVRLHAGTPRDSLEKWRDRDDRVNRLMNLQDGKIQMSEPVDGTIEANRLVREGREQAAIDCLRECLVADDLLWELMVKLTYRLQGASNEEYLPHRELLESWLESRPLSGFPEWRDSAINNKPICLDTLELTWQRAHPHSFLAKWILSQYKSHFPLHSWKITWLGGAFLTRLMKAHR